MGESCSRSNGSLAERHPNDSGPYVIKRMFAGDPSGSYDWLLAFSAANTVTAFLHHREECGRGLAAVEQLGKVYGLAPRLPASSAQAITSRNLRT